MALFSCRAPTNLTPRPSSVTAKTAVSSLMSPKMVRTPRAWRSSARIWNTGAIRLSFMSSGSGTSAQAVEAEGAAGQHLVPRLGGQRPEPLAQHLRRAREEAVLVRIVGGPQDLVRPDVAGQHRDAALDRLERDPAIALEQLARPHLRRGLVEAQVIEVAVHAVEPRRDPAAARLEKRDA